MIHSSRWFISLGIVFIGVSVARGSDSPAMREKTSPNVPVVLNVLTSSKPLRNGVAIRSGNAILEINALRDDVLRIRVGLNGKLPEDASWAVLQDARAHSIDVSRKDSSSTVGFQTAALRVEIERSTLRLQISDLNGNVLQEDALPVEFRGDAFRLYKQMPIDEHYFGLGDKMGPLDRRNQAFTLWNTDAYSFQESTDPLYKSIPFFLSVREGRTTGILLDNTWCSNFDFGKSIDGVYSFGAEGGPIDYYIFSGPDPKRVVETYAWLTGLPPLPPLWSLGFQQSRYSYETESQLRAVAAKLREDKIPADALYLDIDYQKNNRPFTVDPEKFPNFAQMLGDLKKQNFHVVAITDLHVARVENQGYTPYDTGVRGDHFVKNLDGSIFVGTVWPGPSVFPDFTQQSTREWWGGLYTKFVSDGLAGFWNDMNEPSVFNTPNKTMPDSAQHRIDEPGFQKRTVGHRAIHDVYGMENSRATYEGLLKLSPDSRPFVLTRATYAGGQRYAATWTGDNSSTWNHLRMTTPMLLNLGLSGFGLSGADVGGFVGTPQPDLLTKWIEIAAFQPIDRDHTEKGSAPQEPWVHGPEQEAIRRRYIEERYRLMPYFYTTVEEMSRTGVPVVRPLFLEFPNATADAHPLDLDAPSEFFFGPDILVAPPKYPDELNAYEVKLPPGKWYRYWTGDLVKSAQPELVHPALDTLPVYVREGSIIPMQPLTQSTGEVPQGPLTLRVYPGKDCRGSLYQDDGKTMAYKRGQFLRMKFTCELGDGSVKFHIGSHEGPYQAWWDQLKVELHGWDYDTSFVTSKGQLRPQAGVDDREHHTLTITIPDDGHGNDLEIRQHP
ncbi:MAG: Alpha-glucosidase [Acidobacteriaceae bacterium]|nr:Alpha-glucosidase [Acidobacteriaceae bacterium]